ncbi:MAG: hypothetical protein RBU30_07935 [Polyangia bacterium]|jgi:hypothetical protein|nr:hypothetical protein [Polyangia bacterium]
MPRIFISQEWLNQANVDDRVAVSGQSLTILGDGKTYQMEPAVHFLRVEGGDPDEFQLIGTVKTMAQLRVLGADPMDKTVIVQDRLAYSVEPGYAATYTGSGDPRSFAFR